MPIVGEGGSGGGGAAVPAPVPGDDAIDLWAGSTAYTAANNIFRLTPTQANAVDANGDPLTQGEPQLLRYATVPHTSNSTPTLAEIALMVPVVQQMPVNQNATIFAGAVNGDARLASFAEYEALHFQVVEGSGATLTSANAIGSIIDGNATLNASGPVVIPEKVQGFLYKVGTTVNVVYTTGGAASSTGWAVSNYYKKEIAAGDVANPVTNQFTFTPDVDGAYVFTYSADAIPNGTAWSLIGTTGGGNDVLNTQAAADRLTAAAISKSFIVELKAGTTYHVTLGRGGGGITANASYEVRSVSHRIDSVETDLLRYLSQWDRNNTRPPRIIDANGQQAVRLERSGANSTYRIFGNVAATTAQTIRISIAKQPAGAGDFQIRHGSTGNVHDLFIDRSTGAITKSTVGNPGGDIDYAVEVTDNSIDVVATFPANVLNDQWIFVLPAAPASVFVDVLALDLNYARPVPQVYVPGATGVFRIGEHRPATPINTSTAATGTDINTGFDLTQYSGMTLKLWARDQGNDRAWQVADIDIDNALERSAAGDATDAFAHLYDNDYWAINIVDPANGVINLRDVGRDFEYIRSALYVEGTQVSDRIGMYEWGPSGRTPAEGYLAMTGLVPNGRIDYPIAAARNPLYAGGPSGNDFDFGIFEGAFLRNLGGNAGVEGTQQPDQQAQSPNNPTNTQVNPGGGMVVRGVTTANETRPINMAVQLYMIVDTYRG